MNTDKHTENRGKGRSSRLQLILVALIFVVPMVAASWMYFADSAVRPASRTNHGVLLDPIVNLPDELGTSPLIAAAENRWTLIYLQSGDCEQACRDALYKQRQVRLMLGNDMSRVLRILLHGPSAPDTLFLSQEHAGLLALQDGAARQLLLDVHPRGSSADGFYLTDPLGNLVMYFPLDIKPRDLVDDIEHLLKLSRIG
jgi:cytochrome oxidase Cu insertion factor (SCO1/SenC/PrrC family)